MALIHTCYRITDIDRSVAFYEALGFKEIGRIPIREEAVNVFMNQPGDGDSPRLELTYNFGVESYDIGTGYGHIAREAALLHPRGRLAALLRQRSRWIQDRDHQDDVNRCKRAGSACFVR
jgi:catechol 2,3-dioxygenase-like lactoylglutathione lyase family enzyme